MVEITQVYGCIWALFEWFYGKNMSFFFLGILEDGLKEEWV